MKNNSKDAAKGFREEFEELHQQSERIRANFYETIMNENFSFIGKEAFLENHLPNNELFHRIKNDNLKNNIT